jgi:translation initiation factor 2 subunit 2
MSKNTNFTELDNLKIINPNLDNDDTLIFKEDIEDQIKINTHTDKDIIYTTLLDDIFETISGNNELFGNKNINISKPDVKYENRKTFWYNYGKNCSQINRSMEQLKKFIEKEISVETSINEKSNLIIRGKYNFTMIAGTYKKYIQNYVKCSTCKSMETEIVRNSSNRLDYLKCLNSKCNTCKVVIKI